MRDGSYSGLDIFAKQDQKAKKIAKQYHFAIQDWSSTKFIQKNIKCVN